MLTFVCQCILKVIDFLLILHKIQCLNIANILGDPTSIPSQEILRWQFRTIESMYKIIAIAIEKS